MAMGRLGATQNDLDGEMAGDAALAGHVCCDRLQDLLWEASVWAGRLPLDVLFARGVWTARFESITYTI
jgi:hypothetical protein